LVLLRDGERREAELDHLAVELTREADGMRGLPQLAEPGHLGAALDELARRVGEHRLLFVRNQPERRSSRHHFTSGRPSTCLAMMFRWISDEPPSMVFARERSHSRVNARSTGSKPGPSQPSDWRPPMACPSS